MHLKYFLLTSIVFLALYSHHNQRNYFVAYNEAEKYFDYIIISDSSVVRLENSVQVEAQIPILFLSQYYYQVEYYSRAPRVHRGTGAVSFSNWPQSFTMSLCEWYANRAVLLTGVTSEFGRVLLEKILRCLPNVTVCVVLRSQNGLSVEDRLKKIFASSGYERVIFFAFTSCL